MNTNNINKKALMDKLNEMLEAANKMIPVLNGNHETFAYGYAEGIADVLYILANDTETFVTDGEQVDDNGWWDSAEWGTAKAN